MKWLSLLALLFCHSAWANVEVGKAAPNFKLPGHDGKTYELSGLKGKWVVLEWFNHECPYVKKHYNSEFMAMQNLQKKWRAEGKKDKGLIWLAVNSSAEGKQGHLTKETAPTIAAERKANMNAILLDPSGSVGKTYGAKTTPHMYIINPEGTLVYNGAIDDQPSAPVASLKGAKNYVTAALTSLFAQQAIAEPSTKPYGCSVKY